MNEVVPFDFDRIEIWAPELHAALDDLLPSGLAAIIADARPEYLENARDILFDVTDRAAIVMRVSSWIAAGPVAAYHGSRLTPDEIASVQRHGRQPLVAESRAERLRRALTNHPRWPQVASQLDETIHLFGAREYCGRRQGQVHLTVSRAGLMRAFNHYLTHGSEFDGHVAHHLLAGR